jgi:hypothetical protein
MTTSIRIFCAATFAGISFTLASASAAPLQLSSEPDTVVLRDGTEVRGLIVRNSRGDVVIQTPKGEETYQKSEIGRIRDADGEGAYLTIPERKGSLPPWRTIANDLRHNDGVRKFEQIPATVVDNGVFKNVPYLSFRLNGLIEVNIYGDPDDPAGLEVGIYGALSKNQDARRMVREFIASYLNSREEIAALYQLNENKGLRDVGPMTVEYTPPSAPDAEGAWWLSVYNRKEIADARLTDAEYARLTMPVEAVQDKKGAIRETAWEADDKDDSIRLHHQDGNGDRLFVRGFYRDKEGNFRLLTGN